MFTSQFSESAIETSLSGLIKCRIYRFNINEVKTYLALEKYVQNGKIKSIGLSNFLFDE